MSPKLVWCNRARFHIYARVLHPTLWHSAPLARSLQQLQRCPGYRALTALPKPPFLLPSHLGGEFAGDDLCATGYTGPRCAVCKNGFFKEASSGHCYKCDAKVT